jgi:hypothetical protein
MSTSRSPQYDELRFHSIDGNRRDAVVRGGKTNEARRSPPLVDEEEQARLAEEAETQRERAAWENAERRRIYIVGVIVVAAMIALFARAFMQAPIRF